MIQINDKKFADNAVDYKMHPDLYDGMIRRYATRLDIFDKSLTLVATINKHGVLIGATMDDNGKNKYRFVFRDDPVFAVVGGQISHNDLRAICTGISEKYINTIPDGGKFSAFPDHTYRYR